MMRRAWKLTTQDEEIKGDALMEITINRLVVRNTYLRQTQFIPTMI
jgi:hypothetical protein